MHHGLLAPGLAIVSPGTGRNLLAACRYICELFKAHQGRAAMSLTLCGMPLPHRFSCWGPWLCRLSSAVLPGCFLPRHWLGPPLSASLTSWGCHGLLCLASRLQTSPGGTQKTVAPLLQRPEEPWPGLPTSTSPCPGAALRQAPFGLLSGETLFQVF